MPHHNEFSSLPCTDGRSPPNTAAAPATEPARLGATEEREVWVLPSPAFGMHEREKKMVFEHLLLLSVDMSTRWEINVLHQVSAEEMAAHHAVTLAPGLQHANAMAALITL
jgi:hypothetical protein